MPSTFSLRVNHWLQNPTVLWAWLRATALLLAMSIGLFFVLQSDKVARNFFKKNAVAKLKAKIEEEHTSNLQLKEKTIQNGFFNFKQLAENDELQYIFNSGNLVFWSDNHHMPEYARIKGDYTEKYIEMKSGKFLVVKDTFAFKDEFFEIVNLIPLYYSYDINNQYIRSGSNMQLFPSEQVDINNYHLEKDLAVLDKQGNYLFSVQVPQRFKNGVGWLNFMVLTCLAFFLVALTANVWSAAQMLHKKLASARTLPYFSYFQKNQADFLLLVLFCYAVLVRALLLVFRLPHSVFNVRFFNPQYYAWHSYAPSPGDLLVHLFFVLVYVLVLKHLFRKTWLYGFIVFSGSSASKRVAAIKIVILMASHWVLFFTGYITVLLFSTLKLPLDISELLSYDVTHLLTFFSIVLSISIFIGISRLAYELLGKNWTQAIVRYYLPSSGLFLLGALWVDVHLGLAVVLLHLVFFGFSWVLTLPPTKHSFDYAALVFFTVGSLVATVLCAYALLTFSPKRDLELKRNYINQQLVENNLLGERLLNEISEQVKADLYIANAFSNPMFSVKDMEEKVRRFYLGNYLNRYDIAVMAFDENGQSLNEDDYRSFAEMRARFPYRLYKTNYPEVLYYITQQNQILKNYLGIVPIFKNGLKTGMVLIDIQPKKFIPNSILPVLLVDKKADIQTNANLYSYAVFSDGNLTNSYGNFNFSSDIVRVVLADSMNYNTNLELKGSYFLVSDLGKGRKIIVQSEKQSSWVVISNATFLFVLMEMMVSLFFIGNLLFFNFDRFYNSLTFKIQFYSVLAFFIPIFLVSGGVLTAVISTYNQELQNHFKDNATNIAYTLSDDLERFYSQGTNIDKLHENILRTARLYNTDVNIYRKNGHLLASSSPVVFKAGLMSPLVDPRAYFAIRQEKNKLFLQEEKIGKLHYNHVYIQVRSSETGEELGIISIPFFASGRELSTRITNALKIIVNVATLTFMVFLFFSFTASNFITYPLKLITNRIKKTTLDTSNRPLQWKSKDELGLLIREYNLMIQKLEQNKRSLAISQKESAWREVAQQVAHEIKNPLTPIKLSLQHLRRVLQHGAPSEPSKMDKTIENLIGQVETLDGIASSFSIYAKMPAFHLQMVDLKRVVAQVIDVYAQDKRKFVRLEMPEAECCAVADDRMLGRILANLLLNAFQAVPNDKTPEIVMAIKDEEEQLLLSVSDNGTGIPEEVAFKVFDPHFSTKFSGSGIGLYIAKKGIEQMGGAISFETSPSAGTCFLISLKKA